MAKIIQTQNAESKEVARIQPRPLSKATVGKPRKVIASAMRSKVAYFGGGGASGGWGTGTITGSGGNFFSPELSTDFLELPQSEDEERNYCRFFYEKEPFVGQAIDQHVELPLSKIRLGMPRVRDAKNRKIAEMSLDFCVEWAEEIELLQKLLFILHDYTLLGVANIFVEDKSPDMPREVIEEPYYAITEEGAVEGWRPRENARERTIEWLKDNYTGWTDIQVLPPDQVHMESWPFSKEKIFSFVPDSKTKEVIEKAQQGDPDAKRVVESFPVDVVNAVLTGQNVRLNTDPDAGSFVYRMSRTRSQYDPKGHSILERVMRVLIYRDKLRQAQTSIASRHMTPMRLVFAEGADETDVEDLRDQVDFALQDPDYSIITNFRVEWEEMGADQRLLDLTSEYDLTDRQLYAGLGTTESMLSGEGSYSGDRINLEVVNARYMLMRELLQGFVEKRLLKPMCKRMGFVEKYNGKEYVLFPSLTFTRLPLRDNSDTFDALFNLYQKGSLDIDVILEMLNIDPVATREKLKRDRFTQNDPNFNEVLRGIYNRAGDALVEQSNVLEVISEELGLEFEPKQEGGSRF